MSSICTLVLASVLCTDHSGYNDPLPGFMLAPDCCAESTSTNYTPQPGDLILFQFHKKLTQIIYRAFRAGEITHVAIVVRRPNGSLALLDAPGMRYPVMLNDLESRMRFYKGKFWVRRLRCPLTPAQSACLTEFACAQDGKKFHRIGLVIPTFGLPRRRLGLRCTSTKILNSDRWFCSSLSVAAAVSAGLIDPCEVRPRFTSPQDLYDNETLDLSAVWNCPISLLRFGPRDCGWWSENCCGQRRYWE